MYVKAFSLKQHYRSKITYKIDERNALIEVTAIDGIFHHLENIWKFAKDNKGTIIDFSVDFEFKSKLLDSVTGPIFKYIAHEIMSAFEKKAKEKHGKY
jgi:coenzyme Q-binding protein COQ10